MTAATLPPELERSRLISMSSEDNPEWNDLLPSRAHAVRERAEREAAQGIEWTDWFSPRFQRQMLTIFDTCYPSFDVTWSAAVNEAIAAFVHDHSEFSQQMTPFGTLAMAFGGDWASAIPPEQLDWLAAIPIVLERFEARHGGAMSDDSEYAYELHFDAAGFASRVNDLFLDERIAYVYINRRIRPRSDAPLHLDLIQPIEVLLSSDPRFKQAEAAYLNATSSLAAGQYGAAITSASSTLQEALTVLGAPGSTLRHQFVAARKANLFKGHDDRILTVIEAIGGWFNGDRSARGGAHGAATARREDAELAIHIAAATVLRLTRL
jgi:hypothetical protein